jgi:anthranilate synthase component 2
LKILVLDNYDSFTFNLVHYVEEMAGLRPAVFRNDEIRVEEAWGYDKILLSPGPGLPSESGILCKLIRELSPHKSILGICLGLQAIGEVFGGQLENLPGVFHGVSTPVFLKKMDEPLFDAVPSQFKVGRYHSWAVSKVNLPDCFHVTCEDAEGRIMGLTHKNYDLRGVQFHPESVMTEYGKTMIKNWLAYKG